MYTWVCMSMHAFMHACGIQRSSSVAVPQDAVHFIFEASRSLIDLEIGR